MANESREVVVAKAIRYLLDTYSPSGTRVGWLMIATIFIEAWDLYSISFVLIFIGQVFHPSPWIVGLVGAATQGGAVIGALLDQGDFLEVQLSFAQNILIGFGRIAGRTVGIIANQPSVLAGALDINASDKAARFIRFCNAFNIPLLTLVDVPGFMPGVQQEYGGIIRHGAKLLFAYSAATVPKVTVIVRKAYGGAYLAMCGKDLGADRVIAWPTAQVAVMGAEGAVEVVFRKEINEAKDKKERRKELIDLYRNTFSNPYVAGATRLVDDIIEPAQTRRYLAMTLEALQTKRELRPAKKHGLMPL